MPELLLDRNLTREEMVRHQPLEEVVVATVAFAVRETDRTGQRQRLEHRAHGVHRNPEPVDLRSLRALEVVH